MWRNKGIVLFLIFAICNFQVTNCSNVQAAQFHKNFHCDGINNCGDNSDEENRPSSGTKCIFLGCAQLWVAS